MDAALEGIVAHLAPGPLWRTDVGALARFALVCTQAAVPARERLLWLRDREQRRRARVRAARRFLCEARLHSREWTHNGHFVRTRVDVLFNGRISVRETIHFGRSRRAMVAQLFTRDVSRTYITLDVDELGTVISFPWMNGVHMGRFYGAGGLWHGLHHLTHVGHHFVHDDNGEFADQWVWHVREGDDGAF